MEKSKSRVIYIIGSLRNKQVPIIANQLRKDLGKDVEIFDSWYSPGPRADDYWRDYCKNKGLTYKQALADPSGVHVYQFDKSHLDRATDVVLIQKAGKSCHLELGYSIGKGKRAFMLYENEPIRYDVMMNFLENDNICFNYEELIGQLNKH